MPKPSHVEPRWLRLHSSVLVQACLVIIPLTSFTGILLGMVYLYSWQKRRAPIEGLTLDSSYAAGVLYVDYSATRLILVASWSSSVAIPLIGQLCNLASYVVAADMAWSSKMTFHGLLPTPSQLALLTDLLDAKKLAIFMWFSDLWSRANTVPSRWMIEFPAMVQIAGLVLSVAILAADTWLHIATSSVTMHFLSKIDKPQEAGPQYLYSRNLTEVCFSSVKDACSVVIKHGQNVTAFPDAIRDLMIDNPLTTTTINETEDGTYFLAPRLPRSEDPSNLLNDQIFSASTLGSSARCEKNITTCTVTEAVPNSDHLNFACPAGMNGSLTYPNWLAIGHWYQTSNESYWAQYWDYSIYTNDVQFGVVAFLENNTIQDSGVPTLNFTTAQGQRVQGSIISASCSVDFFALDYSWTNETDRPKIKSPEAIVHAADVARAPVLTGYFSGTDFAGQMKDTFSDMLGLRAKSPVVVGEAAVLSKLEKTMGFAGLSLLGGTFEQTAATKLALANSTIVTQVGKTPLFTLVILNLWYAAFGLGLSVLALFVLRDEATKRDIIEVQQLITVNGLATAAVKRQRGNLATQDDDLRVGVEKVEGEWQFRVWDISARGENKSLLTDDDTSYTQRIY